MLDGKTFVCLARTVSKRIGDYRSPETFFSIGLGFDISHSKDCIYANEKIKLLIPNLKYSNNFDECFLGADLLANVCYNGIS